MTANWAVVSNGVFSSQMESAYGHGDKTRNAVLATKEARAAEVKFEKDERAREALEASRQLSKKKKKKKKKNPDEIEWCVRVHMIELSDVPEAPAFGMMNTFVAFEMNSRQVWNIFVADYFYFIPLTLDQKLTGENANENEFRNTALGTA